MKELIYKIIAISILFMAGCIGCSQNYTNNVSSPAIGSNSSSNNEDVFIAQTQGSGGVTGSLIINGATTIIYQTQQSINEIDINSSLYSSGSSYVFIGFNSSSIILEADVNSASVSNSGTGSITLTGNF